MKTSDLHEQILKYLTQSTVGPADGRQIDLDSALMESGVLDSMGATSLIAYIEKSFHLSIPDQALVPENFASVRAVADMVVRLKGENVKP